MNILSFDDISQYYLTSLYDLLREFPDLLKELSDQFRYKISANYPAFKVFLERSEMNRKFYCYLATQFKSRDLFLYHLLKGMVLDSILQLEQKKTLLKELEGSSDEKSLKEAIDLQDNIEMLNEDLASLSRLACCVSTPFPFRKHIFPDPENLNHPILKFKIFFICI